MALSKVNFNSLNVTPSASKAVKFNSSNNGLETGDIGGNMVLLSTQTASSSATIDFTSSIDSTYKEYIFKYIDCHPATDNVEFQFNMTTDGTNFNVTKTSSYFNSYQAEDNSAQAVGYNTTPDLAQSTNDQILAEDVGNDADQCVVGTLHLFEPSSTTFVKHYLSNSSQSHQNNFTQNVFCAGYGNTTSAITGVRFKFSSGNIDAGTIKMYGVL